MSTETVMTSLIDGEERSTAHPQTFTIPDEAARHSLKIGDFARIGLESDLGGERFWVIVTEIRTEQDQYLYAGTVHNDLVVFDIPFGELMEFDPNHVLDIIHTETVQ